MNKYTAATVLFLALLSFTACLSKPAPEKELSVQELILAGKIDEAKSQFLSKSDINATDADGNTALHVAARIDAADLCTFLIIKGADTSVKNHDGDTALHAAIKNNAVHAAATLAAVGGDMFTKDANGTTALELALAASDDYYDIMITTHSGDIRDVDGESIVHYFVKTLNQRAITMCINKKLPLSVEDNNGITPLGLCYKSSTDPRAITIASMLIEAGAAPLRGDFAYFEDSVRTRNVALRFDDAQTPLHLASIEGHTGIVQYLLAHGASTKVQDIGGATPLHEAVRYGHADVANLLLAAGADVNARDSLGKTPLLLIMPKETNSSMYQLLLSHGANARAKDMFGDTALHVATMAGLDVSVLQTLVSGHSGNGSDGADVTARNKQGVTPLSLAVETNIPAHIQFYASHGADINAADQQGNTPLTRAFEQPTTELLKMLVSPQNTACHDSDGNTPLHVAIIHDASIEAIRYLVSIGADVNTLNSDGNSPLYLAVQKNREQVGTMLISKDADVFATNTKGYSPLRLALTAGGSVEDWFLNARVKDARDGAGNTPLHYAAEWKLGSAIQVLLDKGVELDAKNANGETPLFNAVKSNSPEIINLLVTKGADKDMRDVQRNTVMHAAVRWNAIESAKTLIGLGTDINARNVSGKSPLSDAIRSGKKDMAILLIENKADINSTDATGKTILVDAIQTGNTYMTELVLQHGGNPALKDMYGRNAYHEAAQTGSVKLVTLVREAGGDPLSRDSTGKTPFSLALNGSDALVLAVLGSNRSISDSEGNTPVHIAVQSHGSEKLLTMLLANGYPADFRNGQGLTPLTIAVKQKQLAIARLLLEKNADPFIADNTGSCAVDIALKDGDDAMLSAIVKSAGTKTDIQGAGILHYAARTASAETVKNLVAKSLDRAAKDINGETPYDVAKRWKRDDIAELLKL